MTTVISSKKSLMDYAKEILLKPHINDAIHITYNAESDSVLKGLMKCYILPEDDKKAYLACELMSLDGGVYYGVCVYSYEEKDIYFTDWHSMCKVNIDDYIKIQ